MSWFGRKARIGGEQDKAPGWQEFAMNLLEDRSHVGTNRVTFEFTSTLSPGQCMNQFDQLALEQGWRYFAELVAADSRFTVFRITVDQGDEAAALDAAQASSR